jgi:hypothetical protein
MRSRRSFGARAYLGNVERAVAASVGNVDRSEPA